MARQESEREDLLREATAFRERVELRSDRSAVGVVFVGFRADGGASFYFGGDPVFHFNSNRELRRAYVDGELLKADKGKLVAMRRTRQQGQVQLTSRTLSTVENEELLAAVERRLDRLRAALRQGDFTVVGQIPPEGNVLQRVWEWLAGISAVFVARSPRAL
jgi:hypothetical protein